jgi:adenosylmethionine-8-amino-7-oxononanoate aminotransferase
MSSGYGPIGAMIASERVIEPFLRPGVAFPHGYTFGGHPVAAAVSLANLDLMERERLNERPAERGGARRDAGQAARPADRRRRAR